MKKSRNSYVIFRINTHYKDLLDDLSGINTPDEFSNSDIIRRAILFDFLQIGELFNHLSKDFIKEFNNKHSPDLIGIRNRIVHRYASLKDDILFSTIQNDLPRFIKEVNEFAREKYNADVYSLLGKRVVVQIDRPIGTNHESIIYPINYGYIKDLTALDGEFQDVYILGIDQPLNTFEGKVIAIVHRLNDIEDKLIIVKDGESYSDEEILNLINFQEQYFNIKIIRKHN